MPTTAQGLKGLLTPERANALLAAMTLMALLSFLGAIAAVAFTTATEGTAATLESNLSHLPENRVQVLQDTARKAEEELPLTLAIRVPHHMSEQIPQALMDAGDRRGWLFEDSGKDRRVTMPVQDLHLFNQALTDPQATMSFLQERPTADPQSPLTTAEIRYHWEWSTTASAAYNALLPTFFATLSFGLIFITTATRP